MATDYLEPTVAEEVAQRYFDADDDLPPDYIETLLDIIATLRRSAAERDKLRGHVDTLRAAGHAFLTSLAPEHANIEPKHDGAAEAIEAAGGQFADAMAETDPRVSYVLVAVDDGAAA